jgi:quinol monooxygenase YgiN
MALTVNTKTIKPAGVIWFAFFDPVTFARITEFERTSSVGCHSRLRGPALDDENVFYTQEIWESIEAHDAHVYKRVNNADYAVFNAYNKGKGIKLEKTFILDTPDGGTIIGTPAGPKNDLLAGAPFKKPLPWLLPQNQTDADSPI